MDQKYYSQLREMASGKDVSFIHGCDDEALVAHYRQALCVVLPSVYKTPDGQVSQVPELLGQTLLEGMACATPAICTDVASMPEIVEHGVTGFVVPPNDPVAMRATLELLQKAPEMVAGMGQESRRRVVKDFTWPAVVQRCLEIYQLQN
jgi:glycosyltransferase involved in cell wall biosynthesis